MESKTKLYKSIVLIAAGIGALSSVTLLLVLGSFSLPVQISLAVLMISLAVYAILDPNAIKAFFSGRQAKYGSNSLVLTIVVLGILIIVNLIGYNNTLRWDLTEDKTNTLAVETLDVLKSLDDNVFATGYFTTLTTTETAENLLKNFKTFSNGKFDYEFIDPNENPVAANDAGITRDGSIVLSKGGINQIVTTITEENLTAAIIKLKSPEEKAVYVLTGHGEPAFSAYGDDSYYYANDELKSKNYIVSELNLLVTNAIPENAAAIIITGPTKPLSNNEVSLLQAYTTGGGSLMVMYEPRVLTDFGENTDPLNDYLTNEWGISIENNFILDLTTTPSSLAVAASYGSHPITEDLQNMVSLLPTASSLSTSDSTDKIITDLALTSDQTWAEYDLASLSTSAVSFDENTDLRGPVLLTASAEDSVTGARVVVFGDSDFASNAYYQYYANADLFLNTIDWLAGQEQLINLTARTTTQRLLVPPSGYTLNAILLAIIVLIPGAIITAAVIVFVRRSREI